jgi:hypothetical protein
VDSILMMKEDQFNKFVLRHHVVVVHFSHHGVMGHEVPFPEDLRHALKTWTTEIRSCCALWPGHKMNLPGSVGLIYRPTLSNIVSVGCTDSGSSNHNGREGSLGEPPSAAALVRSLRNVQPGDYNEWRIVGAQPTGIFVASTSHILVKKWVVPSVPQELLFEEIEPVLACAKSTLEIVATEFSSHNIYTLSEKGLVLVRSGDVARAANVLEQEINTGLTGL